MCACRHTDPLCIFICVSALCMPQRPLAAFCVPEQEQHSALRSPPAYQVSSGSDAAALLEVVGLFFSSKKGEVVCFAWCCYVHMLRTPHEQALVAASPSLPAWWMGVARVRWIFRLPSLRASSIMAFSVLVPVVSVLLPAVVCLWPGIGLRDWFPRWASAHREDSRNSCVDKCGLWTDTCWCDRSCEARGNCCTDYARFCGPSCPKCYGYTCDEWIAWDPRYTCDSLTQMWGCDCSACLSCSAPPAVRPSNAATLRLFDAGELPGARCLDGSMAGYYFRAGDTERYLVFLEGGGWCYDPNCAAPTLHGTLQDCRSRSFGRLGSSMRWPALQDSRLTGHLSADPQENPVFHDWTLVYVPYCDGASFTGSRVIDGLHFRGTDILNGVISDLKAKTRIRDAKQVVLSGGSAGASAVYYHVDAFAEGLSLSRGEVVGIPDAGFFLDLRDKDGVDCWPNMMRSLFGIIGYTDLHSGCQQRFKSQPWKCLFPENYVDLIRSRLFAVNSFYDLSEFRYTLRLDCCPGGCSPSEKKCNRQELAIFHAMRSQHAEGWRRLAEKHGSGVWAPACIAHTMAWGSWTNASWEVPAGSGNTMAAVVGSWLAKDGADASSFAYQDEVAWPGNRPCAGDH